MNRYITSAIRRISNAWPAKPVFSRLSAPVASFTFDDFPHTAWINGAPILESFGVRGTYFVAHAFSPENLNKFPDTEVMTGVSTINLMILLPRIQRDTRLVAIRSITKRFRSKIIVNY